MAASGRIQRCGSFSLGAAATVIFWVDNKRRGGYFYLFIILGYL
jgi:hypothetical protein